MSKPELSPLPPPSKFVVAFSERLPYTATILDAGCYHGRNSIFLSKLGHQVIGISNQPDEVAVASSIARREGVDAQFLAGDILNMPFRPGSFDVVICNEVLQDVDPTQRRSALANIQQATRLGGFNAVSGYLGDKPNAFREFELLDAYSRSGWQIETYEQDAQLEDGHGGLLSLAKLISYRS